jgi:rhamnopyranosyl-N-acetylglucosaminyl-diphospho-decaprenol beta-1,3/1,4-galactofuranosyltransferase
MKKAVCAVMVTYNRLETLKTALNHILNQTVKPAAIIIVDNNSTDGTREYLASVEDKAVKVVLLSKNEGPAGGICAGMKYGLQLQAFDYFWILDDDTFYAPNALSELVDTIGDTGFAMLGLHGANIRFGKKVVVDPAKRLQPADYVMIDGAIIKTEAIQKIGPVSQYFFMMCEDEEYCMRLKKHGYTIGVLKNGADDRQFLGGGGRFTNSTLWRGYYSARNHLFILKQYFSIIELLSYISIQLRFLVAAALLAPDRFKRVKLRLLGIWHGIKGVDGKTLDPATLEFVNRKPVI